MADRDSVDLLNGPVELARKLLAEQNEFLQGRLQTQQQPNPVRQLMKGLGLRVKDFKVE